MQYSFESNEFTTWDLLQYVKRAYGQQVNGNSFSQRNVEIWIREKKLPDAYGGNKILNIEVIYGLNDLRVLTIEHLDRNDIEAVYGSLDSLQTTLIKEKGKLLQHKKHKRVARTQLYYQTLRSKGIKKSPQPEEVLPDNWREAGIKSNQINNNSQRKKK